MEDENAFINGTMSVGSKNTCKLFDEDIMKAFLKGLPYCHPKLFSDEVGPLLGNYLDEIWFVAGSAENVLQFLSAWWWANGSA